MAVSQLSEGASVCLDVKGLDVHGDGVARGPEGLVVFVAGGVPGDRVQAVITQRAGSYARARVVEVLTPSPHRVQPPCPVVGRCGGCPLMTLAYPEQLERKRELVRQALQRLGPAPAGGWEVLPTIGMEHPWAYRNRAQFPVAGDGRGGVVLGFYRRGTHEVVPVDRCAVAHPTVCSVAQAGRRLLERWGLEPYDETAHRGFVRHLVARVGQFTGQALALLVTRTPEQGPLRQLARRWAQEVPQLVGVVQNVQPQRTNVILGPYSVPLWGQPYLEERLGHLRLRLSATAFFQVNSLQALRVYETVRSLVAGLRRARPGRRLRLVDLYCGAGGIGLYCAGEADELVGVEERPEAVDDARYNARLNGVSHARFVTGRVEEILSGGLELGAGPGGEAGSVLTAVVVDPPRAGLAPGVVRTLAATGPPLWVYVSCNAATMARDLGQFLRWARERGWRYRPGPVQPVDMFPHTAHVEAVACLVREDVGGPWPGGTGR